MTRRTDPAEILAQHRAVADAAATRLEQRWWANRLDWWPPQPGKVSYVSIRTYKRMTELKKYILLEVEP